MSRNLRERLLSGYARTGWRGFDRLLRLAGHRPGERLRARTRYGTWFELDPWSYIDRFVLREGFYESEVLDVLVEGLAGGGVLWDVGANIGLHGLTAKAKAPEAQVVCFEPSPPTLGILWRHVELNGFDVEVLGAALSDRSGLEVLHVAPAGNTGQTTLSPWPGREYMRRTMVATVRGDQLVAGGLVPAPTVIKLDVEGHEAAVLRGLTATLATPSCRRVVFEDKRDEDAEAKRLLRAAGFEIRQLARQERSAGELENYLAVKT